MADILIKGAEKPKSCFTHTGRGCDYHQVTYDGSYHACFLTHTHCKCNRLNKDCPISNVKLTGITEDGRALYVEIN